MSLYETICRAGVVGAGLMLAAGAQAALQRRHGILRASPASRRPDD